MTRSLTLLLAVYLTSLHVGAQECEPCARNADGEIEEPGHGGNAAFSCANAADEAATLNNGTAKCRDHQLLMWQRNCCPDPPMDHCFLCDTYNADKIIPKFVHQQFGSSSNNITCANVNERIQFLDRDGIDSQYGNCDHTERGRARAWCECEGVLPECSLKCPDGTDIPDPDKADPLFGETCARWMFETSVLSYEACQDIEESLFFSAVSFCCNMDPPATCKICSDGRKITNSTEAVFRGKTCAEMQEYADWLPGDSCIGWFSRLVDDPFDADENCCVVDDSAPTPPPGSGAPRTSVGGLLVLVSAFALY
eukprot:scaffold333_cov133-Cylindrotheca_fusiformis.AAC.50